MARPKKVATVEIAVPITEENAIEKMDSAIGSVAKKLPIEDMPLTTLREYMAYNTEALRLNNLYKIARYPIKPCPVELHPKERIVFGRNDQPSNPLKVYKSDSMIDFKMTLEPGKTYDLPTYIVDYLSKKGSPIWKWKTNPDGSKETFVDHYSPRFAIRTVYAR